MKNIKAIDAIIEKAVMDDDFRANLAKDFEKTVKDAGFKLSAKMMTSVTTAALVGFGAVIIPKLFMAAPSL